jgi:hypothetical protein
LLLQLAVCAVGKSSVEDLLPASAAADQKQQKQTPMLTVRNSRNGVPLASSNRM